MSGVLRLVVAIVLAWTVFGGIVPEAVTAQEAPVDLANLPLRPDELPEPGYQVMTGGFLDRDATATWIADPRRMDAGEVERALDSSGWEASYALDLVLLEDRAYAQSEILALIQTNVYLFTDASGAEEAFNVLDDFDGNQEMEHVDAPVIGGTTVRLVTESGDSLRTQMRSGRVVVEVLSLESYRPVDPAVHTSVVIATLDRINRLQGADATPLSSRALLVADGDAVADLFNAPGTGVHQVYRIRDDRVQPGAGELAVPERDEIAPGLSRLLQGSQGVRFADGAGFFSTWIGEFTDETAASSFVGALPESSAGAILPDPYFTLWAAEDAVSQGIPGVYRVSGTTATDRFSGTLEIRQHGTYVVGVGWRVVGDVLPSVDVTSRLMDAQLSCLDRAERCVPFAVDALLETGSATPVASVPDNVVRSDEFGWTVPVDPAEWSINEQYAEQGYDFVELQSGNSLVTLESVIDQHGDPQECVIDGLDRLRALEEHAAIDLGSDVADEVPAGMEPGHAWVIYTVEPFAEERADQEYTIRIDCYTLVAGGASLVATQTAPRDLWADERDKGERLREGVITPSGTSEERALNGERMYHWRHMDAMIDKLWISPAA